MKNTLKKLFIALFFLVAINSKASDGIDLSVQQQQSLVVEINKIEDGSVLSLVNSKGEIFFKDRFFKENSYSKIINFEGLPDGKYLLIMDKKFIKSTSVIIKENELVSIEENSFSTAFKPYFEMKGDMISLFVANPAKNSLVVEVYDSRGESVGIYKSKDLVIKKTFDFSRVDAGEYTFKVKTKSDVFTETLTII